MLMAFPAVAHPGSLWGIDLSSVVTMRDQARVIAHAQDKESSPDDPDQTPAPELERVRTIVLDPGHGGDNSGAIGIAGIPEKRLTLELAYALRERLQEKYPRLRVILTRYWDTTMDLSDRIDLANKADADLFLSLHYNAAPHDRAIGFETYYLSPDHVATDHHHHEHPPVAVAAPNTVSFESPIEGIETIEEHTNTLGYIEQDLLKAHQHDLSGHLAETVQNQFGAHLNSVDRGVKQAPFSVLKGANMPAVVVEAAFVTHPKEGIELLTSEHQAQVVSALVSAVEEFDAVMIETLDDGESTPPDADEPPGGGEDTTTAEPVAAR